MVDTATTTEPQAVQAPNDSDHAHQSNGAEFNLPDPQIEISPEIEDILASFEMDHDVEGKLTDCLK